MRASAIVYTSNTGFTRKYAQMLGERTRLPVYDLESRELPADGTKIVYMGWLMAGSVKGLKKAQKRWNVLALCPVGMAPDGQEDKLRQQYPQGALFYLQGGYEHKKLHGVPKMMMNMLRRVMSKKPDDPAAQFIMETMEHGGDWVSADNLAPVVSWLEGGR